MSDKSNAQERIDELKAELGRLVGDWRTNSHSPPNHIRQSGDGKVKALVDRWCGGYQNVHFPTMIGWKVERANNGSASCWSGVVLVNNGVPYEDSERTDKEAMIEAAIEQAKAKADLAIESAMQEIVPGFTFRDSLLQRVQVFLDKINDRALDRAVGFKAKPQNVCLVSIESDIATPIFIREADTNVFVLENENGDELFRHHDLREVVAKACSIGFSDYAIGLLIH